MEFVSIKEKQPESNQLITAKIDGTTTEYLCWYDRTENGIGYGKTALGFSIEFDVWTEEKRSLNTKKDKPVVDIKMVGKTTAVCKKHGEYTTYKSNKGCGECPVCAAEAVEKERGEREQEIKKTLTQSRMKRIFDRSCFPKLFKSIGFEDYNPANEAAEEILKRMTAYAENFEKIRELGSSVLFIGGTGTGKSMLAAATGNAIMMAGYTVMYLTCPQALSWVKRSWVNKSEISQDEYLNRFKEPDLLILDEVPKGCKNSSDWEMIHEILDRRYQDVRPTISISTLPEKELERKMTKEIIRRMYFRGRKLIFNWEPYEETGLLW